MECDVRNASLPVRQGTGRYPTSAAAGGSKGARLRGRDGAIQDECCPCYKSDHKRGDRMASHVCSWVQNGRSIETEWTSLPRAQLWFGRDDVASIPGSLVLFEISLLGEIFSLLISVGK